MQQPAHLSLVEVDIREIYDKDRLEMFLIPVKIIQMQPNGIQFLTYQKNEHGMNGIKMDLSGSSMFRFKKRAAALTALTFIGMLLLGFYGVWIPDLIFRQKNIICTAESKKGYKLKIIQFWGTDFYTTQAIIVFPNGESKIIWVDGDDLKWWSWQCKANIDEAKSQIDLFWIDLAEKLNLAIRYEWGSHETIVFDPQRYNFSDLTPKEKRKYWEFIKEIHGW